MAVLAVSAVRTVQWYGQGDEDWRAAVAYVDRQRGANDDVAVTPSWALPGFRFYDGSTEISYAPIRRRTFVVALGYSRADLQAAYSQALKGAAVTNLGERAFGSHLHVYVVEPPAQ